MRLVIQRGCAEIGGTSIELSHADSVLLLDVGLPLGRSSSQLDPASLRADAVLISHGHRDHFGLIESLDASIPIYISRIAKALIEATRIFIREPPLANTFCNFEAWEPFRIGGFLITPYLVDHSAPDAFGFLIESGGVRLFYSGDFRAHGRKSGLFDRITQRPPPDIDVLIMEGTMIRRDNDWFPSESAVEDKILETIQDQRNISFLVSSSQNIDRIVSAYRACLSSGKILVIDVYTAWVLEQMKAVSSRVPNAEWDQVRVYIPGHQYETLRAHADHFGDFVDRVFENRVERPELHASPARFLYLIRMAAAPIIKLFKGNERLNVIYSQWRGYLDRPGDQPYGAKVMAALREADWVNFIYAHTSGHAVLEDLKRFAKALSPRMLIPVHTEHAGDFGEHFDNVVLLEDGQPLHLPSESRES